MIVVTKLDGVWQRPKQACRVVSHAKLCYADGRSELVDVKPYEIEDRNIDLSTVQRLVDEGVWTQTDLDPYGFTTAQAFVVPEGKRIVHGTESFVERKGAVYQVHEIEDIPPPPPEPTIEEKLAALGVTKEELAALVRSVE